MRKHFLILMLLTLLPFAGFADNITVTPGNASKMYGDADPETAAGHVGWFSFTGGTATAAQIAPNLPFLRLQQGEELGGYSYTFDGDGTVEQTGDNIVVTGQALFTIKQKDLTDFNGTEDNTITLTVKPGHESAFVYNGQQVKPTADDIVITVDQALVDGELTPGVDFVVKDWGANNAVGAGTITITGKGNYKGDLEFAITITCPQLSTLGTPEYFGDALTYKAAAWEPLATAFRFGNATDGYITTGFSIKAGSYQDNVNAGTASVTLVGDDALYSGEVTATFPIGQLAVSNTNPFTYTATPVVYNGAPQAPVFTSLKVGTYDLAATDYELTALGTNAGDYAATLKFAANGNFSGANQTINYTIDPQAFNATNIKVDFNKAGNPAVEVTDYVYTTEAVRPAFTVTYTVDADHKYVLTTDDYTFTYKDNSDGTDLTNVGAKKLIVTGKGNFTTDALDAKVYNVVKKTVKVGTGNLTVGMGADVVPVPSYDGFIAGHSATSLSVNPTYTYTLLNGDGSESATTKTQAQIKTAEVGKYNIHVNVDDLNTDADAATTDLKNYRFVEAETKGILTKMVGQVTLKVVDRTITYGDAFPVAGWTVEHISGLAEEDVATFIAGLGLDQNKFALVTEQDLNANATGYDVAYDNGSIVTGSYVITVQTGKLIVDKYLITSAKIGFNDLVAYTYTGTTPTNHVDVDPTEAFPGHAAANAYLPTNYYTTVFDENYNAGTRKARVSATTLGAQNYRFETDVTYTEAECNTLNAEITGFVAAGTVIADAAGMNTANGYSKDYANGDALLATDVYKYNTEIGAAKDDSNYKTTASIKEVLPYVEKEYTITKRELTITADDFTGEKGWIYGTEEPAYTASLTAGTAATGEESLIDALLAGEQPEGFNGTLVIKRGGANVVGDHVDALTAYLADENGNVLAADAQADNYTIIFNPGDLTIKKGKIVAKVKDAILPYGEVATDATFHLEAVSGMDAADAANFDEIVTYNHSYSVFGYNATTCKNIDSYTLTFTGATPVATNYDVEIAEGAAGQGTLTVTKRPVTFKVVSPAEMTYTEALAWEPVVNGTYVKLVDYMDAEYDAASCYSLLAGDEMTDLISAVVVQSTNVGENVITLTTKESDIYKVNVVDGVLTINATGVTTITLNRVVKGSWDDEHANTAATVIANFDNKMVNVKFSDFSMIAEKWYPLVLPFATSVREISKVFGYAVVDIFNGTTANGDIKFKLHMGDIEANTPFIVKVYEDQNMNDVSKYYVEAAGAEHVKFANVKMEKAYDANGEVKIGDASDVQFVGSYKGKIDGFRSNMYYFSSNAALNDYYQGSDTNTTYLRPLGAYFVDNSADAGSKSRGIIIEEADGSTTAISAITVDGAFVEADGWYTTNGVKLQGVPTEKGVYIRNGKKIVIK